MIEPAARRHRARSARPRILLAVVAALTLVFLVNALRPVGAVPKGPSGFVGTAALPVLWSSQVAAWHCPGPLPIGSGRSSSEISVANITGAPVPVTMTLAVVSLPKAHRVHGTAGTSGSSGEAKPAPRRSGSSGTGVVSGLPVLSSRRFTVPPLGQVVERLPATGPAAIAGVSVEAAVSGIAVQETVSGAGSLLSSPCAVSTAAQGFVPTGSTFGSSDVLLALYDPGVTPAIANLVVSIGASTLVTPAFQGVVVPARGLTMLDIGRWVPQRRVIAVSVSTIEGRIVVGALDTTAARVAVASRTPGGAHVMTKMRLTGGALLLAAQSPLRSWGFPTGRLPRGVAEGFAVFAPGRSPVHVSVAPADPKGAFSALTAIVPAGGVATLASPVTPTGRPVWGSVTVRSTDGGGIVVARVFAGTGRAPFHGLGVTSGTSGPVERWVLPRAARARTVSSSLVLVNPRASAATVTVQRLSATGLVPTQPAVVTVPPYGRKVVSLPAAPPRYQQIALLVSATDAIFTEQVLTPSGGLAQLVAGIPIQR